MAKTKSPEQILAERMNVVLGERFDQLVINLLGLNGGRPYVDERLSRFAGEADVDWNGGTRTDGSIVTGRKEQAHSIPYLGRIAAKINQHVLGVAPIRKEITPEIDADITSDGQSITEFTKQLNSLITACRWAWIGIDAPALTPGVELSQADKEAQKIRPYWTLYSPLQVVDWFFNKQGILQWLITETEETIAPDPFTEATTIHIRRLWQPGMVTAFHFEPGEADQAVMQDPVELSYTAGVPFVLAGTISADPYGFDDLESINRTIMDLESCNRQNFFNTVFPQMKVPASVLDTIMEKFKVTAEQAVSMISGFNYPILMGEGDPEPGYIMPDASAIGTVRVDITALKRELFDSVGLMLQQESRQVASAEAKAWDFLDIQAVMRERAQVLEDAEKKAVEISHAWDPDFPQWEPAYNREFEISNLKEEIESLVVSSNVSMPEEMQRFILSKLFSRIDKIGADRIDPDTEKEIIEAIQGFGGIAGGTDFLPQE